MPNNTSEECREGEEGSIWPIMTALAQEWGPYAITLHLPTTWRHHPVAEGMGGEIRKEFDTINSIDIEVKGATFSSAEIGPYRFFRRFELSRDLLTKYQ